VFKNLITPKPLKKNDFRNESDNLPPIMFERGEMHLSFMRGMDESVISKRGALQESGMSMMDNSLFKPRKSRKRLEPIKQSTTENESLMLKSINEKER
jgi:hypothetical protein